MSTFFHKKQFQYELYFLVGDTFVDRNKKVNRYDTDPDMQNEMQENNDLIVGKNLKLDNKICITLNSCKYFLNFQKRQFYGQLRKSSNKNLPWL